MGGRAVGRYDGRAVKNAAFAVLFLTALPAYRLTAQCPDGSPPPCRGTAAAVARRPNPPLDEHTWIVVPFDNVARAPDIDWLRDASVNLLYLDMSKWHDIKVIDDERVADFIRDVPEARGSLTLQSGIAVARRAGAGKLVMGDLIKLGTRTRVVAKVFDVRSGQRLRTVNQEANGADSIMGAFGSLARAVLDVEAPAGVSAGEIGTSSVAAYQSYLTGLAYLNRWILDSAQAQFETALRQDSGFALAHYKLSLVYGWQSGTSAGARIEAQKAVRSSGSLPQRERDLITGHNLFETGRYADACSLFSRMLRGDSTDVEAWYELGECSYHDAAVMRVPGDTTRFMFRSSWNTMIKAFHRTLQLDPSFHLAFQHIQDALLTGARTGCRMGADSVPCSQANSTFQAMLRRSGDTLVTEPIDVIANSTALVAQQLAAIREHARRQNLEQARGEVETWLAAGPDEDRPRMAYARILLDLGRMHAADSVARLVGSLRGSRVDAASFASYRLEIALKNGDPREASRIADSLRAATDTVDNARALGVIVGAVFGHVRPLSALILSQAQGPAFVGRYFRIATLALTGAPADSVLDAEAAFVSPIAASQGADRAATLASETMIWLDPAVRAGRYPVRDSLASDPRLKLASALGSGDPQIMRAAVTHFDSLVGTLTEEPDAGFALARANAHLAIGDSAGALAALRLFRDSTYAHSPLLSQIAPGFSFEGLLWARSFLLLGDLAAAAGQRDEAARAYRMFVGMWQGGDDAVQPLVRRAQEALGRLGS